MTAMSSWGAAPHGSPETWAKLKEISLQYLPPQAPPSALHSPPNATSQISLFFLLFLPHTSKQTTQCQREKTTDSPGKVPPSESSTCVIGELGKKEKSKALGGTEVCQGWGKAWNFLNVTQKTAYA